MGDCALLPSGFKKYSKCITNTQKSNRNSFTQDVESKLCLTASQKYEDSQFQSQLPQALQRLAEVDTLILQATQRFHDQKQILSALDVLLRLKTTQIESDSLISRNIVKHLDQMLKALKVMVSTSWNDDLTSLEVESVGSPQPDLNATIASGDSHPGLKKILSTGGFVFLIFSTASDVCTVTGGAFCIFVYLAGAGGIGIWLNSIYKIAFNI